MHWRVTKRHTTVCRATGKNRIYFQIGECYRLMYNYPKAEHTYHRLIQAGYYTVEPKLYFYMAEMCRFNGKFDEADGYYDKYLELVPGDKLGTSRKKSLIDVTRWAADRSRHIITKLEDWSTEYNDWSPRFLGDDTNTLVFSSSRFGSEDNGTDVWTGQNFSSLYSVPTATPSTSHDARLWSMRPTAAPSTPPPRR